MGRRLNPIYIDGEKVRKLIEEKGMTFSEVSRNIGRSSSYLHKLITTPNYSTGIEFENLLCRILGVEEGSLVLKDEKKTEEKKEEVENITTLTPDELSKLIYKAVFMAVKHAWENLDE